MNYEGFVDAVRREGNAYLGAARTAGIDAPVPSCPEWKIADLVAHLGRIHHFVGALALDPAINVGELWEGSLPGDGIDLIAWAEDGAIKVADGLAKAGPGVAMWSWAGQSADSGYWTSDFWARRQAHETAMHRWDAQGAAGSPAPIDRVLAVDGIDEYLELSALRGGSVRGSGETIHLHCTDGDGEWMLRRTTDGLEFTHEHGKGDVAARGTANDLLLMLSGRLEPNALEVFGDAALLERWQSDARW